MLRRLWLFSVGKPDSHRRSTLALVMVYTQFGRWRALWGLENGDVILKDSNSSVRTKTYRLTPRVRLIWRRYCERPAPTTESSERA